MNTGAWAVFQRNAYSIDQHYFPYVLLNGYEVMTVATRLDRSLPAKLRLGSSGQLVEQVQNRLKLKGYLSGNISPDFDGKTLTAVLKFQKDDLEIRALMELSEEIRRLR